MRDTKHPERTERCRACREYFTPREMSIVKAKHCIACACPPRKQFKANALTTIQRALLLANK